MNVQDFKDLLETPECHTKDGIETPECHTKDGIETPECHTKGHTKDGIETPECHTKGHTKDGIETPPTVLKETMASVSGLTPSNIEKEILELVLQGVALSSIAYTTGVPEGYIRTYIKKEEVREFIKDVKAAMNEADQLMISGTLRKMVGERITEMEAGEGATYANLSNKDTLDILKAFSDITSNIAKAQKETKETSVFATIYQQILKT